MAFRALLSEQNYYPIQLMEIWDKNTYFGLIVW